MRMNSRMERLIQHRAFRGELPGLPDNARALVKRGWIVGPGGALLLGGLWGGRRTELAASELGRYEYEINDVNLSLTDLADDSETYLARAASRSFLFAKRMLQMGARLPGSETLHSLIGVFVDTSDEDFQIQGVNVRFFTERGDPIGWFDDLERFEHHALALLDLSDLDDFGLEEIR